jgi:hypothetical protein
MKVRRADSVPAEAITLERSSVHILHTEEELREAVRRASEFDQRAADTLQSRSRHYQTLVEIPIRQVDPTTDAG